MAMRRVDDGRGRRYFGRDESRTEECMSYDGDSRDETAASADAVANENVQNEEELIDSVGGSSDDTPVERDEAPDLGDALRSMEEEIAELKNQLLRKSADFDNYRKRMQREKEEFAAYANRELLLDIVPIIDDFERAIKSSEESHDFDAFHNGIVMIEKQFTQMLERKWRLQRFDSVGEEFDPQRHEAMMTEDAPGKEHPVVLEDFQKGYLLHDKVLRPAKVKVAMPVAGPSGEEAAPSAEEALSDQGDGE